MCHTGKFDLSYQSLTSFTARKKLCNLKSTNPEFWQELTTVAHQTIPNDNIIDEDDVEAADAQFDDDSDLPCDTIIEHVIHGQQIDGVRDQAGHLASTAAVEAINYKEKPDWADKVAASVEPSSS
jgi:hypothetical protein